MRRRWFIIGSVAVVLLGIVAAALAIRNSGLVQPEDWEPPPMPLPVVSTRGQFADGEPVPGVSDPGYTFEGHLPGLESALADGDLVIVIHGFNNTAAKARYKFGIATEALKQAGYSGGVAGFSWDADMQRDPLSMTGYHSAMRNAAANGPLLAEFIKYYRRSYPQARVHLIGYSMGARVALEALLALCGEPECAESGAAVASVHLVGAAVENEDVELGERYGEAVRDCCGMLWNYHSPEDNKLGYFFPLKEGDRALGLTGIEHSARAPENYRDVDASDELPAIGKDGSVDEDEAGDNHSGYLGTCDASGRLVDDGVMDLVAANITRLKRGTVPER